MHAYPENLEAFVREHWQEGPLTGSRFGVPLAETETADPLPPAPLLRNLLSTCYQASLMRDENRAVLFRIILCEPERFARESGPPGGLHRLSFARPIEFSANELRRLSHAAPLERTLIAVRVTLSGPPEIWGLVHTGSGWLAVQEGERREFQPLPAALVIVASGPGWLTVARGSFTIARLQAGRLLAPSTSLLETDFESPGAAAARQDLLQTHAARRAEASKPWADITPQFPRQLRTQLIMRMMSTVRTAGHGGTLLLLPPGLATKPETLDRYVRLKYVFQTEEPRLRARTLILRAMDTLAEICAATHVPPATVGWNEYVSSHHPQILAVDEAITELAHFLAGLTAVDGAVAMTYSLELLGFGGEISGALPDVQMVERVTCPDASQTEPERATSTGTRHRSAYRLCKAVPNSMAIVLSQDGGLRVVTCVQDRILFWEQITTGVLDL